MNKGNFSKIDEIINNCTTGDLNVVRRILELGEDFDFDGEDSTTIINAAISRVLEETDEGFEYFCSKAEEAETGNRKSKLFQLLAATTRYDKIKEYIDNAEKYGLNKDSQTLSVLIIGLARSQKYRPFIEDLIKNKSKYKELIKAENDSFILPVLGNIDDVDFIDSFIRNNQKSKNEGAAEEAYYDLKPEDYLSIIAYTRNKEYIKKCYYDKELQELLQFGFNEKAELAFASKDLALMQECIQSPEKNSIPQEKWVKLLLRSEEESIYKGAVFDSKEYGVDLEYVPLIINKTKMPLDIIKDLPIFKSEEGTIALELYSGESDTFDSNYTLEDIQISLPEDMTIGVEIESTGFYSHLIHRTNALKGWQAKSDDSITNNDGFKVGVEVISPVLSGNNEETTKSIVAVTKTLKAMGQYTNSSCGGHVHIGADYLKSEQAFRNLFELWSNNEKILYIISNKAGELPRDSILKYAAPVSQDLENSYDGIVQLENEDDLDNFKNKIVDRQTKRMKAINFKNLGAEGKNTIEFRLSNGTVDSRTWIENVNLYGGLIRAAQELAEIQAKNPMDRTQEEIEKIAIFDRLGTDTSLSEVERAELFIKLVIGDEKLRPIYMERYNANRELLNQNPELEKELDEKISHSLVRYSDKNTIGREVFNGNNPVIGMQIIEVENMIKADRSQERNPEFPTNNG